MWEIEEDKEISAQVTKYKDEDLVNMLSSKMEKLNLVEEEKKPTQKQIKKAKRITEEGKQKQEEYKK